MDCGDIVWVEFPIGAGRAQAGRRPAIVVQSATVTARLPTVLLIPLTTQKDALRFPGTVLIEPNANNGLRSTSVALVFQMTVVDRRFIGQRLGRVADDVLASLWTALDELIGRSSRQS